MKYALNELNQMQVDVPHFNILLQSTSGSPKETKSLSLLTVILCIIVYASQLEQNVIF
jgi:hypothetical protein